jgi:phage shock protein C
MNAFALDRPNAKLSGVCAGIARATNLDPFLVRAVTALSALFIAPVIILLYFLTAWIAPEA